MKTGVAVFGRPKGKEVRGTGSFSDQALTKFLYGSSLMPSEENLRQGEHVVVLLQMDGGYKGLSMIISLRHANSHPNEDQRAGGFVGAAICFEGLPTAKCGELLKRLDSLAQTLIDQSNGQFKFAGGESNRWPIDLNSVDLQGVASPFDSGSSANSLNHQDITIGVSGNPLDQCIGLVQFFLANPTFNSHAKLVLYDKQKQSRFDSFQGVKNLNFFDLQDTRAYRQKQAEEIKKLNLDVFRSQKESLIADKQKLNQDISALEIKKEKLQNAVKKIEDSNPRVVTGGARQGVVTSAEIAAREIGSQASNQSVELLSGELERVKIKYADKSEELKDLKDNYLNIPNKALYALMAVLGGILLLVVMFWAAIQIWTFVRPHLTSRDSTEPAKQTENHDSVGQKEIDKIAHMQSDAEDSKDESTYVNFSDWLEKPSADKESLSKVYKGELFNGISDEGRISEFQKKNLGIVALSNLLDVNEPERNKLFYEFYEKTNDDFESNNYFLNLSDIQLSLDTLVSSNSDRISILDQYRKRKVDIYEVAGIDSALNNEDLIRHFRYVIYHVNRDYFNRDDIKRDLVRSPEKEFKVPIVKVED